MTLNAFVSGRPLRGLQGDVRQQLRLMISDNTKAEYFKTPRLDETTNVNPSVSVGGPILQNKIWFFAGFNPRWESQDRTVIWTTPAAYAGQTQSFNAKSTNTSGLYNVTYSLSPTKRIRFNGANERSTSPLALPAIDSVTGQSTTNATTFNPRATVYTAGFNDSYSGTFDWTVSNSMFLSVNGGYLGYGGHSEGGDYYHGVRRNFITSNVNYLDVPTNLQQNAGYFDNLSNTFSVKNDFSRFNVNVDATKFFTWKGQHSVKVGAQLERFGNSVNNGDQFPNLRLNWNATRSTLSSTNVRGTYGYYEIRRVYTIGDIHSNNVGLFAQDQWTVNNKLTLNYGLRVDQTNIPSYREENEGIKFGFGDKIAPRVGFAYDLRGDGMWKALRLLGRVLRHREARDAAGLVRRQPLDQLLLDARQLQLAGDRLRRHADEQLPGHVHRAGGLPPRLERPGRGQPRRSEPRAVPDAGNHVRHGSAAQPDRSRSARATRTSG